MLSKQTAYSWSLFNLCLSTNYFYVYTKTISSHPFPHRFRRKHKRRHVILIYESLNKHKQIPNQLTSVSRSSTTPQLKHHTSNQCVDILWNRPLERTTRDIRRCEYVFDDFKIDFGTMRRFDVFDSKLVLSVPTFSFLSASAWPCLSRLRGVLLSVSAHIERFISYIYWLITAVVTSRWHIPMQGFLCFS